MLTRKEIIRQLKSGKIAIEQTTKKGGKQRIFPNEDPNTLELVGYDIYNQIGAAWVLHRRVELNEAERAR